VRNAFTDSGIVEDLAEVVIIAVLGDFHDQVYFKKKRINVLQCEAMVISSTIFADIGPEHGNTIKIM
jgi:hypothetical protein